MKKWLSLSLAIAMLFSISMVAFANENNSNNRFIEAGRVYVEVEPHSLASEAGGPAGATSLISKHKVAVDIQHENEENLLKPTSAERAVWRNLVGFQVYNQSNAYNCGPACVQAVLAYITGSSPSQSEIALRCYTIQGDGTDIYYMWDYINNNQSTRYYDLRHLQSKSLMASCLQTGIMGYGVPSIIGLTFVEEDGWPYNADQGHYMTVHSAKSDQSAFGLGDPWIGYSSDPALEEAPWSYVQDVNTLYNAYNADDLGFMF